MINRVALFFLDRGLHPTPPPPNGASPRLPCYVYSHSVNIKQAGSPIYYMSEVFILHTQMINRGEMFFFDRGARPFHMALHWGFAPNPILCIAHLSC